MLSRALLLSCALLWSACGDKSEKPTDPGDPKLAVSRLFDAISTGDCAAILDNTTGPLHKRLEKAGCAKTKREMAHYKLESVISETRDGRTGGRLVRTRFHGVKTDVIIRVELEKGTWRVANL